MKSKVAVIPCEDYEEDIVFNGIKKGIELLGGLNTFIQDDENILLKPNLLNRADIEKAVTTHPVVFGAVARLLKEHGYENLSYGDSPGHPGSVEKTAEICGIKEIADNYNIKLGDFTKSKTIEYSRGSISRKFEISQGVLDVDGIINICKMKTHQLERITGGVKNLFGCVCGFNKGAAHTKYPDADSFAQMLVDLNLFLKARLHIMDGIVAMEGNGPASGNPIKMNVVLISTDPVALDATFCRLVDLDPQYVPTVFYGELFGLGHWKEEEIEIVGIENLMDYKNPEFDISREKVFVGKWSFLEKFKVLSKKPVILKDKCIKCLACIEACPLEDKALTLTNNNEHRDNQSKGKKNIPEYDYKKCIKCYCCQEMCPEKAIVIKRKFI